MDITLRCALNSFGEATPNAATVNFATLLRARFDKETKYWELLHESRCQLIVVGIETGRWSDEALGFVERVAHAKSREAAPALRRSAFLAWRGGMSSAIRWLLSATCTNVLLHRAMLTRLFFFRFGVTMPHAANPAGNKLAPAGPTPETAGAPLSTTCPMNGARNHHSIEVSRCHGRFRPNWRVRHASQLPETLNGNLRMPLMHHGQAICPTRPECWNSHPP